MNRLSKIPIQNECRHGKCDDALNFQFLLSQQQQQRLCKFKHWYWTVSWYKGNAEDRETPWGTVQCEGGTESETGAIGRAWGFEMVSVEDWQMQVALGLAGRPLGLRWGRGSESGAWRQQEVHAVCCWRPCSLPEVVWGRSLVQWSIPRALQFQSIWWWLTIHYLKIHHGVIRVLALVVSVVYLKCLLELIYIRSLVLNQFTIRVRKIIIIIVYGSQLLARVEIIQILTRKNVKRSTIFIPAFKLHISELTSGIPCKRTKKKKGTSAWSLNFFKEWRQHRRCVVSDRTQKPNKKGTSFPCTSYQSNRATRRQHEF